MHVIMAAIVQHAFPCFHCFCVNSKLCIAFIDGLWDQLLEAAKEGCRGDLLDLLSEGADIEHKGEVRHGT